MPSVKQLLKIATHRSQPPWRVSELLAIFSQRKPVSLRSVLALVRAPAYILETLVTNPSPPHGLSVGTEGATKNIPGVNGGLFLQDDTTPLEWTQIYDPVNEFEHPAVGLSG